jgi:glycine/D-amino acid oxidase-like deaminating enzyme
MLNSSKISYWERKQFFDNVDLLVIGAGIVGYSTALHFKQRYPKSKVLLLERGVLPSGASSKNAGFACFGSPTELKDDLEKFDATTVWDTVAQRWEGLQYLEELIGPEKLELHTLGSWDLIRINERDIHKEVFEQLSYFNEMVEKITGEKNTYTWDSKVASRFRFQGIHGGFRNRLEGQLDTSKMNAAYYQKVIEAGIHVVFGVTVTALESCREEVEVNTSIGALKCGKVAICTNGFAREFLPNDDIHPARAQVLITEPIPDLKVKGTFHYQQGYYYFRNIDSRILLGGGRNLDFEGETTTILETSPSIQDALLHLLNEVILPETKFSVAHTWAGVMGVGKTKKPIIKELSPNIFCGVRLGGMGVAIGSLVGKQLAQKIG